MEIKRVLYLKKLIDKKDNGMIKIITGIRRCGKTYLLFKLFYEYLLSLGIKDEQIIRISLDDIANKKFWDIDVLYEHLMNIVKSNANRTYIFIDEIQFIKSKEVKNANQKLTFHHLLISLMKYSDVYVTGSNSRMLSSEIATEFRGRGDVIQVYPLSFKEYKSFFKDKDIKEVWKCFYTYGGLPQTLFFNEDQYRVDYLTNIFSTVYLKDIIERYNIKNDKSILDDLVKFISSNIGSLTNPLNLSNTFKSNLNLKVSSNTIKNYLSYMKDSFIINECIRYNINGKKYINSPSKFYFSDLGIRNSIINFKYLDIGHLMENVIYNHLILNGYTVNIGSVSHYTKQNNKTIRENYEIDFIAQKKDIKIYIQSCTNIDNDKKKIQEIRGLNLISDPFKRIVVINDDFVSYYDDNGILYISIFDFLLNEKDKLL